MAGRRHFIDSNSDAMGWHDRGSYKESYYMAMEGLDLEQMIDPDEFADVESLKQQLREFAERKNWGERLPYYCSLIEDERLTAPKDPV